MKVEAKHKNYKKNFMPNISSNTEPSNSLRLKNYWYKHCWSALLEHLYGLSHKPI